MPSLLVSDYSYDLPKELIASTPSSPRDHSKLLTVNRKTGEMSDKHFYDLADLLTPDDVLVLNQTKVFPARLFGTKSTGGKVEVILLSQVSLDTWTAIGTNLKIGNQIIVETLHATSLQAQVLSKNSDGELTIKFSLSGVDLLSAIDQSGHTPLPPYIHNTDSESELRKKYQTVYAKTGASAAAPTAGLHFTDELFVKLKQKNIQTEFVTLNVGLGTFQNLRPENLETKTLHTETYELEPDVALRLNNAKRAGKRIIAVGTTTTRVLETCALYGRHSGLDPESVLIPSSGSTNIFIYPPYKFKFVDSLITNFHLPESSLLMLVSALYPDVLEAYSHAIKNKYRFFSFGDAMWIY